MLLLQIETSALACSVALSYKGELVAELESEQPNQHSSSLTLLIQELLASQEKNIQDLSAIAVSEGPGSYTGLRIGVSTAKGICYAQDIPLIGISTLKALYNGFLAETASQKHYGPEDLFMPVIDARRMEVYAKVYDAEGKEILPTGAYVIEHEAFFKEIIKAGSKLHVFGSGAEKYQKLIAELDGQVIIHNNFTSKASYLSSLAYEKFSKEQWEDLAYFEPFYLKEFQPTSPKKKNPLEK